MKKMILAALLFTNFAALAQPNTVRANTPATNSELTKSVSLNIEPIYAALGGLGLKADVNLSKRWSLGAQGIYYSYSSKANSTSNTTDNDYKATYQEFNLGTTYMLTGSVDHHGMYLNPAVGYVRARISDYSFLKYSGELAAPQIRTTVGYQWIWSSFRLALGGGLRVIASNDIIVKNGAGEEVLREKSTSLGGLAFDIQLGLTF